MDKRFGAAQLEPGRLGELVDLISTIGFADEHRSGDVLALGVIFQEGGGDIQTGPFGSQLHASDYVLSGIPSIMPANIKEGRVSEEGLARISEVDAKRLSKYLTKAGGIVYGRRGDVERCALI